MMVWPDESARRVLHHGEGLGLDLLENLFAFARVLDWGEAGPSRPRSWPEASSSLSDLNCSSNSLMRATIGRRRLTSRWFFDPRIFLDEPIDHGRGGTDRMERGPFPD